MELPLSRALCQNHGVNCNKTPQPLVSCIMPTYNRRKFVPHAIKYFLRQELQNKELIIVDDGTDGIEDLVPKQDNIKYVRLSNKITLGEKLNIACSEASGSIIANWDDDDWYAPRRLNYQVDALSNYETKVCGINNLLYFDLRQQKAYQYKYPENQRKWLLGSSLCYYKSQWETHPFEKINVGMDGLFVWSTSSSMVTALEDSTMSVHMIHDQNVSPKNTSGEWWHHYPVEDIKKIMQSDLEFYYEEQEMLTTRQSAVKVPNPTPKTTTKKLNNIYACLVHESMDCVIDMVRNLHFHDPSSIILLFNGGSNLDLKSTLFPFEEFGATIHPLKNPVKHGYLHNFALECMEFALANFAFDILTIVDSDQLSLKPGYSAYLSEFFSNRNNIGLLSNRPERLTALNKEVWTSIKAFEEIELWRPLLRTFKNGEDKFVHWSFWPSTVFTYDSIKDLVQQFKSNKQLQGIMQRTQIWATEEIIFPTLISLLGYEIEQNPCCSDYVKYQHDYAITDIASAIKNPTAFWMHPVPRAYDNTIRKHARETLNNYSKTPNTLPFHASDDRLFFAHKTIDYIKEIKGWLSDAEAELLMAITLKACCLSTHAHVVEVGSYQGKATVLMGTVARSLSKNVKVYAIDQHDGIIGSKDQGLHSSEPSLESFTKNIKQANLTDTVISIASKSRDVDWNEPISLLLIDGLHDYISVNEDFRQFSSFVIPGGYVAFHDYADYFPDVKAFVNEAVDEKVYRKMHLTDSLIVLQKTEG
jgi:glycosyltransferase involved in cell wall biosynthesis